MFSAPFRQWRSFWGYKFWLKFFSFFPLYIFGTWNFFDKKGVRGAPKQFPKFCKQTNYTAVFYVSYAYGLGDSGFVDGILFHDGRSEIVILKIYYICPLTPLQPKTWTPFLAYFAFWKNSRAAPGWNVSKNVSANHKGAANFVVLSKLGGWGLSPIFGNFSKNVPK